MQINRQTYEEFFLLYADGELNETERREVKNFIDVNPDLEGEFNLINQTVMAPDESIAFPNKEILYKKEGNRKVVMFAWLRYVAAAAILMAISIAGWLFLNDNKNDAPPVVIVQPKQKIEEPELKQNEVIAETTTNSPEKHPYVIVSRKASVKKAENKSENNIAEAGSNNTPGINGATKPEEIAMVSTMESTVIENTPDPAEAINDIVLTESVSQPLDVAVTPRALSGPEESADTDVQYTQAVNKERAKSDMIYFANTSLTKKTKLRGVFRKATRYLERVTSIQ